MGVTCDFSHEKWFKLDESPTALHRVGLSCTICTKWYKSGTKSFNSKTASKEFVETWCIASSNTTEHYCKV